MKSRAIVLMLVVALLTMAIGCAQGAGNSATPDWPKKTISLVVPYAAGGSVDVFARGLAVYLGAELGVTVIVENMEGGGGSIGNAHVLSSAPDGYTFAVTNCSELTLGELIREVPYSTEDFTYLDTYFVEPSPIIVKNGAYDSLESLVEAAKQKPTSFATIGTGGYYHLQILMLEEAADVKFNIVPYTGGSAIGTDLQGGHIDAGIAGMGFGLNQRSAGNLSVIAQCGEDAFPGTEGDIPLIKDIYPDFKGTHQYFGILGPPNMPDSIKNAFLEAYQAVLENEEFIAWTTERNMALVSLGTDAFLNTMLEYRDHYAQMEELIQKAKQ